MERCVELANQSATSIVPADIDGDGDVNLAIPHRDGGQSEIFVNDGHADVSRTVPFGPGDSSARTAAAGDLDGNGSPDIAAARSEVPNVVYFSRARKP